MWPLPDRELKTIIIINVILLITELELKSQGVPQVNERRSADKYITDKYELMQMKDDGCTATVNTIRSEC